MVSRQWKLPHLLPMHQNNVAFSFFFAQYLTARLCLPSSLALALFHMAKFQWSADHFYSTITAAIIKLWQRNTGLSEERSVTLLFDILKVQLAAIKTILPQRGIITLEIVKWGEKLEKQCFSGEGDLRSFSIMAWQIKRMVLSDGGGLSGYIHHVRLAECTKEVNAYHWLISLLDYPVSCNSPSA